jgi:hypothetical protein
MSLGYRIEVGFVNLEADAEAISRRTEVKLPSRLVEAAMVAVVIRTLATEHDPMRLPLRVDHTRPVVVGMETVPDLPVCVNSWHTLKIAGILRCGALCDDFGDDLVEQFKNVSMSCFVPVVEIGGSWGQIVVGHMPIEALPNRGRV